MHILDILSEASIFSRDSKYSYGHVVRLKDSATAMPQVQKVLDQFPDLDGGEKFAWIEPPPSDKNGSYKKVPGFMGTANLSAKSSDNLRFFKRENGEIFAISGSDSAIQGILLHGDRFNRGDVAEALLGASLTAKLVKRGGDRIGKIGVDDVKTILNQAITRGDNTMVVRIQDKNSEIADNINFYLRLPTGSLAFMKNPANWDRVQDLFSSAIEYCNGVDAERYSNYFYRNGKVDDVRIVSDGVGGSKDRKTDVQAVVHETDPETGKVTKRSLKNVDISLKADSDIYGQHGTGGLKATPDKWLETSNALFNQIGVNITMPRYKNDIMKFFLSVYTQATQQLKTTLAGSNANKETAIIEKIADMLEAQGSREKNPETKEWQPNKNLKLLSFKGGSYTMHSFSVLKQQLLQKQINLTAEMIIGKRSGKPSILIKDITSGQLLTEIRFQKGTDKASNYFIKGPLMTELTKIEKHKQNPGSAIPTPPETTATATPPATKSTTPVAPTGTTGTAKPLTIEPVKHDAKSFPQWTGRHPGTPGLAPVGTVTGNTANIPSTKKSVVPAEDEIVAESKKRIK